MDKKQVPTFSKILDWLEDRLPVEEAQDVAEALAVADEETLDDLEWLRNFLQMSQGLVMASLPPEVRAILSRRFAENADQRRRQDFFQRTRASLTFDSGTQLATAGLRSASGQGLQRQLVYSTVIAEVALNILPAADSQQFHLLGQVFPVAEISADAFSIHLLHDTIEVGLTSSDDLGEFAFRDVPEGTYDLILSTDRYEVAIPIELNR